MHIITLTASKMPHKLIYLNSFKSTQEIVVPERLGFVNLDVISTSIEVPAKAKDSSFKSRDVVLWNWWLTAAILCQESDTEISLSFYSVYMYSTIYPQNQTSPAKREVVVTLATKLVSNYFLFPVRENNQYIAA